MLLGSSTKPRDSSIHFLEILLTDIVHWKVMPSRSLSANVAVPTGEVAKFVVNTVNAGAGALAVTVEGPSKVKLECREMDEGYEFTYCPKAPGDYLISIRYAGVNIAGSPFKATVKGEWSVYIDSVLLYCCCVPSCLSECSVLCLAL